MIVGCFKGNRNTIGGCYEEMNLIPEIYFYSQASRQKSTIEIFVFMRTDSGNKVWLNPVFFCGHFQVYGSAAFQQEIIIEKSFVGHGVIDKGSPDTACKINMI